MSLDDQADLDPAVVDAVRRAYVRPVDEATAERHLSAIVAAASAGDEPVARRSRRRRRAWQSVLASGVAALLLPVGLAAAGVSLPAVVQQPYRSVGITLPHQARDASPAPASRPAVTTPATAEPLRAIERPAGRDRADDERRGQRQRTSKAAESAGRQRSSGGPASSGAAERPRPAPRRPAHPKPKPSSSSKPSGKAKHSGPKSKALPTPARDRRGRPLRPPKAPPRAPALRSLPEHGRRIVE